MNLQNVLIETLDSLGDDAAKHFSVTKATIAKWFAGTALPDLRVCQMLVDQEIQKGNLIPGSTFAKAAPAKPAPVVAPVPAPAAPVTARSIEIKDLVGMSTEDLNLSLEQAFQKMDAEQRADLLRNLTEHIDRRVHILVPTTGQVHWAAFHSILGISKNLRTAALAIQPNSLIHEARNLLAAAFLEGPCEWSLWFDTDMVVPFGNARFYKRITGAKFDDEFARINTLSRLTGHKDAKIVGGVYTERAPGGPIIGVSDKSVADDIRTGPSYKLQEVPFVGFGCTAIHRSVFEDIKKAMPELEGRGKNGSFAFFSMIAAEEGRGEDKLFCSRALKCGHQPYLDRAVVAGHIGNHAFMP